MDRFTKRTDKGIAYIAIIDTLSKKQQMYAMFQRLADYEDREEPEQAIKIKGVSSQACPVCKKNVNWNYCPNCGQRIKY